jgi:sec-independent protein translocase protein TatA
VVLPPGISTRIEEVMFHPLAFGFPGLPEMLIILVILLVLFGNRLPGVMRSLGQGITEFKKGIRDDVPDDSALPHDSE